ncbi:MAG: hypothetical protein JWO03_3967 [Bacteroidetes bacterium]|nr:hypothetical protein [Bacteroidota bacterium]
MKYYRLFFLLIAAICATAVAHAHPMPHSLMLIDVRSRDITAELSWPLNELQMALPDEDIEAHPSTLVERRGKWLESYLRTHMSVSDSAGRLWTLYVSSPQVAESKQEGTGPFRELVFILRLLPPPGISPRHFTMQYDAIMHRLVTHKMLVRIRQDWEAGMSAADSTDASLGVLMVNPADNKVPPLIVNLDEGSTWRGFKSMVALGISHISEGTDHLLFLMVLLLPATLVARGGSWAEFGGTKYSLIHLVKIATAFTIGHSITLILGALGWVRLPQQPVEILITVTILITAIHALRPIFPGREAYIAMGFGLIHGLAFATVLAELHLEPSRMALSILGFNAGIELMQLFVILLTIPWLILMSTTPVYRWFRIAGGTLALIAAVAWMTERILSRPNIISTSITAASLQGKWLILSLAIIALISTVLTRDRTKIKQ